MTTPSPSVKIARIFSLLKFEAFQFSYVTALADSLSHVSRGAHFGVFSKVLDDDKLIFFPGFFVHPLASRDIHTVPHSVYAGLSVLGTLYDIVCVR
jgi:hypothetical protein